MPAFTVYSHAIDTRYGQVYNYRNWDNAKLGQPLPIDVVERYANGTLQMAIRAFEMDFVRRHNDGSETSVPIHELYDHHHYVQLDDADGNMAHTLGASFEYRRNRSFVFEAPYRKVVSRPAKFHPFLHLINTKRPRVAFNGTASPLLQCPCTPQRQMDAVANAIDGRKYGFACPPWLASNPACSVATYVGGVRCCDGGYSGEAPFFVTDTATECEEPTCAALPIDRAYFKFTLHYEDATPSTRHLEALTCCSLTSSYDGADNTEFDIEPCAVGTPPGDCVRSFEAVLPLDVQMDDDGSSPSDQLELAYMLPHLHEGGVSISVQDAVTNVTLCSASRADGGVVYGGGSEAGDERGYITGFRSCTWNAATAPRYARSHPMRMVAVYDASRYISGAMARFVTAGHYVGVRGHARARSRMHEHPMGAMMPL